MRTFVNQAQRLAHSVLGSQSDGGFKNWVARFHMADNHLDDVHRNILRKNDQTATAGNCLSHAPSCYRSHVCHDDGDVCADVVRRTQIHIESGWHRRSRRDHKDVVIRQVVCGEVM